jgi:hypothetical protein
LHEATDNGGGSADLRLIFDLRDHAHGSCECSLSAKRQSQKQCCKETIGGCSLFALKKAERSRKSATIDRGATMKEAQAHPPITRDIKRREAPFPQQASRSTLSPASSAIGDRCPKRADFYLAGLRAGKRSNVSWNNLNKLWPNGNT